MQIILSNLQFIFNLANFFESQESQRPPKQSQKNENENDFYISNLKFFHPDLKEFYDINDIVFASKENIYRKIFFFYRRVKNYAVIKKKNVIRANLFTCFRKTTLS